MILSANSSSNSCDIPAADIRVERHHVPGIGRVLAGRRLGGVEHAQRTRPELDQLRHAAGLHVAVGREQVLHGLGADAPFERAIDVRIEARGRELRSLMQCEMQAVERPGGRLELIELAPERLGQLLATDQLLERLVHIERARHELPGAHRAAVGERDAAGAAALHEDAVDRDLRLVAAAGRDEGLHQAARQVERAALAELIAAFEVEGADDRAHRARLRQRVDEPGTEQRHS